MDIPDERRWNHNIHYHRLLAEAVAGATNILDIGCGEGMLARRLHSPSVKVTGIDLDEASIALARTHSPPAITFHQADFRTHPFAPESFDGIASVATLHHMDAETGLTRMAEILRPGGTLAIVGLARVTPADIGWVAAGAIAHRYHRITKNFWEHPSPMVWPPPETYASMRRLATQLLPGARFRRHTLWRYSIIWRKPEPS